MKKRLYITQQARNYYQICYHSIESWDRFHLNGTLDALTNKIHINAHGNKNQEM